MNRITAFWAVLFVAVASVGSSVRAAGTEAIKRIPVQEGGRIKPFDTFARESLQLIYGKQSYAALNGAKRPAHEVVMTWMLAPQFWDEEKIVQISFKGLKDALGLDPERTHFSPAEVFRSERLQFVLQELAAKRETKEKLGPYHQAAQRLESGIGLYQAIKNGSGVHILPAAKGDKWRAVAELDGESQAKFMALARAFIRSLPQANGQPLSSQAASVGDVSVEQAADDLVAYGRSVNAAAVTHPEALGIEVHYNDLHPFMWAWLLYLSAALAMALALRLGGSKAYAVAWVLVGCAFAMHTYGFGLRIYLTGRPPVSNMYESVVWVSWGAVLFSLGLEALKRNRFILLSGAGVGVICLIVADMAPAILDQSLQPLEPVLRSNLWLTVHVLTITLSYSAFFLAWGLSNLGLGFILSGDRPAAPRVREMADSTYRSIQIGTVLLAAGTILGGVWADYSWGRFWGWDPKETWAFIALMGYIAILHGRLAGLIQGVGMLAASVASFSLVIMAWYGVNYVLGAGLHTYGFGGGGVQYVSGFVILNLIYVGYVVYVSAQREKVRASA